MPAGSNAPNRHLAHSAKLFCMIWQPHAEFLYLLWCAVPPAKAARPGGALQARTAAASGAPGRPKGADKAAAPAARRRIPLQEVTSLYANSADAQRRQPSMLSFR